MKTTADRINDWICEEEEKGRTRDEIAGTYFVTKDAVHLLRKSGRNGYRLDTYLEPRAVFLDKETDPK